MKHSKPLSAAMMLGLLTLSACQTPSANASLDVVQLQETAVNVAKSQWCFGQIPKSLDTIVWCAGERNDDGTCSVNPTYGVTEDDYRAAPEWTRIYVVGNDEQWAVSCQP